MPKLSIVIPCYNEQDNLTFIYDRLQKALGIRRDVEIILVNNGSTDRSEFEFSRQQNLRSDSRFHIVLIPVNLGYGYGILTGLQRAQGKILSWTHADLQTDPEDIIVAYDLYGSP
ncbi:MAG: glycosyltransferase family 2 protein [Bdellovibrionales bacterium]|nr:glycosyltransferase family 2 protein [Bdellovibrionales bacterium]